MKNKKTWADIHKDEVFTDNSKIENCKQCKDCLFRDDGTVWSNDYQKSCCQIYRYPNFKPLHVINNKGVCEYYHNEDEEDAE